MLRGVGDVNFIGFVEGRGVFNGDADVVITDGVVGNVMLKLAEGLSSGIFKALAREVFEIDRAARARERPVAVERRPAALARRAAPRAGLGAVLWWAADDRAGVDGDAVADFERAIEDRAGVDRDVSR
jgi:fatty acid/phospholipid biosynthesis enzyme